MPPIEITTTVRAQVNVMQESSKKTVQQDNNLVMNVLKC